MNDLEKELLAKIKLAVVAANDCRAKRDDGASRMRSRARSKSACCFSKRRSCIRRSSETSA